MIQFYTSEVSRKAFNSECLRDRRLKAIKKYRKIGLLLALALCAAHPIFLLAIVLVLSISNNLAREIKHKIKSKYLYL